MRDGREPKSEIENLQQRMKRVSGGAQSPKAASGEGAPKTGSTNTIRLDHSRLLKIETIRSLNKSR
jgi:hypothetical protein